jgi:hypothetical protein
MNHEDKDAIGCAFADGSPGAFAQGQAMYHLGELAHISEEETEQLDDVQPRALRTSGNDELSGDRMQQIRGLLTLVQRCDCASMTRADC